MKRRNFIQQSSLAAAGFFVLKNRTGSPADFPVVRTPEKDRKFKSPAVEKRIEEFGKNVNNPELAWLFANCFPNTLDTTVDFEMTGGQPDTYVITGDIDAMWLRDSSAQVWPYLDLIKEDKNLQLLIAGVIRRQTRCIIKDPYANAFYKDENRISEWKKSDLTDMKPGIHERKWEIDSLCYPVRLAHGYWKQTGDKNIFDKDWLEAMQLLVKTFREQQRKTNKGPYSFQRNTSWATDGVPLSGYGYPVKPNGLICSMFRPSDDATIFPYLVPSNYFASVSLGQLAHILETLGNKNELWKEANLLKAEIDAALHEAIVERAGSRILAYEINGFGSHNLMDDANVPSLLSLPYLGALKNSDPLYLNTRKHVLSHNNPFFYQGKAGEGIGGPHAGENMIWPLSIIMRGLTSNDDKEIKHCLSMLQKCHAGTGFMHESFNKDDASNFTRKWFAWANTLFGEFLWKTYRERKQLLL